MISKHELISMLWGIITNNTYWEQKNNEIIGNGGEIVKKSEEDYARMLCRNFSMIQIELRKLGSNKHYDIPSIVLGEKLPKELNSSKMHELIGNCREVSNKITNKNT